MDVQRTSEGTHEVVLTFDNLGEASELERGTWPPDQALGRHPSVLTALPRLLSELDALRLRATFFIEAINCELYPDALREIAARGHELGMHGWRHERWSELSADNERSVLQRGARAFAELGLEARAFRPPGGELTPRSPALLHELGFEWCSPAGAGPGRALAGAGPGRALAGAGPGRTPPKVAPQRGDGLTLVSFDWELVDAYHLMQSFGDLRVRRGAAREPLAPDELAGRLERAITEQSGGLQTLILHPFLMLDPAWWEGARAVLASLARLADQGRAWVGPGGSWVRAASS
jgi:peptidoglycan/xylan/chitin deacetylase (PgdA/CDA1 family)